MHRTAQDEVLRKVRVLLDEDSAERQSVSAPTSHLPLLLMCIRRNR
jgi:hypothetical protein